LLQHYITLYSQKYNMPAKRPSAALVERLTQYAWPGNVRALRHAVERAVILSDGHMLDLADFALAEAAAEPRADAEPDRLDAMEKAAVARALELHRNNVSRAAKALGLTRASLYRRMEKHGL
jgi:two-component system, NtrC family, response regulator HydG